MLKQAALVAACVAGAHLMLAQTPHEPGASRERLDAFPMQLDRWSSGGSLPLDDRTLAVLGADDYLNRAYLDGDRQPVDLYIGYYEQQRQGSSIHSPLNCLPGSGWQVVAHDIVDAGSPGASVSHLRVRNEVSQLVVLYWYQSHGRVLASEYWSKVYLAFDAVRMRRTDGALVRVTTPVLEWDPDGERTAERRALRFVEQILPLLGRYVPA